MSRIYIVGSEDYLVFVLKKRALEQKEVSFLYQAMQQLGYNPQISYFPYIRLGGNPLDTRAIFCYFPIGPTAVTWGVIPKNSRESQADRKIQEVGKR